jgi:hypothetical protein
MSREGVNIESRDRCGAIRVLGHGNIGAARRKLLMIGREIIQTFRIGAGLRYTETAVAMEPVSVGNDGQQLERKFTEVASAIGKEFMIREVEEPAEAWDQSEAAHREAVNPVELAVPKNTHNFWCSRQSGEWGAAGGQGASDYRNLVAGRELAVREDARECGQAARRKRCASRHFAPDSRNLGFPPG